MVTPNSAYAAVPPGGTAMNATDYVLQLAPTFNPGTEIELSLAVSSTQGSVALLYTLPTGTPLSTTFLSEDFNSVAPGVLPFGWTTFHQGGANTVP